MRHPTATIAAPFLVALLLSGCGPGRCEGDGPGVDGALASAEGWLRVSAVGQETAGSGTVHVDMRVAPIDARHVVGISREQRVAIHSSFLPGIAAALAANEDVFLAMASEGLEETQVSYVIVREGDGGHHFPGECADRFERDARSVLGDRYDGTLDAIVGMTGHHRLMRSLRGIDGL